MALLRFGSLRLLRGVFTLWFAVTVTFFLVRLLPGDPALAVASPTMTADQREKMLTDFGLDQPLFLQYLSYLQQLLQGNLGISFRQNQPVLDILMERLPWTLLLTGTALIATLIIGLPLGVLAATHKGGAIDRAVQVGGVVGQSLFVPTVGIALLYIFGLGLGWFPIGGAMASDVYGWDAYVSIARHLVLPCLSLVLLQIGAYVLTLRTNLIDALGEDYCNVARAKGSPERTVVWKHALRNALLPTTTLVGLQVGFLVGGAVLTETIFAYPGIGRAIYESVGQLDFPVMQGAFVLLAATVVIANFITDLAYGFLDPRVRVQ
ncbi:ABC transporter permease [Phytoactinopolyspora limicola]|uniref:ABC transporter permease n=1 Tax=Phytoactinopolyspora limicola TaxID=2715536 RepID=UPI0014093D11|nr:ABC transporter permease [Phytoactinopolyspora limicola]